MQYVVVVVVVLAMFNITEILGLITKFSIALCGYSCGRDVVAGLQNLYITDAGFSHNLKP
jgi:hypothetical protein